MNWIAKSLLIFSVIALAACASAGKTWSEQTGVVLDEETKEPIEAAIVVARWIGSISQLVDSQTTCYHVETATTDAKGRYRMPAWTKIPGKVGHNEVQFTAYKAGYLHTRTDRATGDQYLRRDTRGVKERLEHLSGLMKSASCYDAGKSERALYGLRAAIYYEARSLHAPGDLLQWMREMAASAWLAHDSSMSQHEHDEAVSDFLKGNLQ